MGRGRLYSICCVVWDKNKWWTGHSFIQEDTSLSDGCIRVRAYSTVVRVTYRNLNGLRMYHSNSNFVCIVHHNSLIEPILLSNSLLNDGDSSDLIFFGKLAAMTMLLMAQRYVERLIGGEETVDRSLLADFTTMAYIRRPCIPKNPKIFISRSKNNRSSPILYENSQAIDV